MLVEILYYYFYWEHISLSPDRETFSVTYTHRLCVEFTVVGLVLSLKIVFSKYNSFDLYRAEEFFLGLLGARVVLLHSKIFG